MQLHDNCLLDLMLAARAEGEEVLSEEETMSHCLNFLQAAYDTTSVTLANCSYLLATNPAVQDKVCSQLDQYRLENSVSTMNLPLKLLHVSVAISVSLHIIHITTL